MMKYNLTYGMLWLGPSSSSFARYYSRRQRKSPASLLVLMVKEAWLNQETVLVE